MSVRSRFASLLAVLGLLLVACQPSAPPPGAQTSAEPAAKAPAPKPSASTRVVVGQTEAIESRNPYAHSVALLYAIWCEVYGCLLNYDYEKGEYVGSLAESWKVENPTTWIFNLRKNVKWTDGSPFTAADVVHTFDRIKNDPGSRQQQNVVPIDRLEAADDSTVKIITKAPTSSLLEFLDGKFVVTSKAQFARYGDNIWNEKPVGTGPYLFKELVPNQYMTITRNPNWWGDLTGRPDEVVFRVLPEAEVRVTALLNNEIQFAQLIPSHLVERVASNPGTKILSTPSNEIMFLAMSPRTPPWDNKLVRQAVAYAIDRDAIVKNVLGGQAARLDGPIGPDMYGYSPELQPRYTYDPARAKQLLAQAGYPNGVDVELSTPVRRYVQDKEVSEAMAQMLTAVGIRTKLLTPEWATLWENVQKGKVPFYYMGRGGVQEPGRPLADYFETGVTPRIGYTNPRVDALFKQERASFDPVERKKLLQELMSLITEDAPAHFLWRQNFITGVAKQIEHHPHPSGRVFASQIWVK
ncbi:MAG: peptide ABC transporter substrate-binding protein [Chloroflexi bacterium]|nr:peptide ABC transporter substrate-binding protein [Chloroflexota bacterium]